MKHLTEEDLILVHYGEAAEESRRHLDACHACRGELQALREALGRLTVAGADAPDPGDDYAARVWKRLEPALAAEARKTTSGRPLASFYWLAAAAAVVLVSFLVGRWTAPPSGDGPAEARAEIRQRILLVALGEHLRESQVLLLEVKNGPEGELRLDRARADDLVRESRLYRQTAYRVGDAATVEVLDQLERLLLDVAHGPATDAGVEALRTRIAEQDVLFKLRVLETSVSEKTARRF